jgi:curved DNA-binding protein CbpA
MNAYQVLQISETASAEVIRAAWTALVRECHPDGPKPNVRRTQLLNEAYATLKDPVKRKALDQQLKAAKVSKPVREKRHPAQESAYPAAYPDPYAGISQEDIDQAVEHMTSKMDPIAKLAVKFVYGKARRRA